MHDQLLERYTSKNWCTHPPHCALSWCLSLEMILLCYLCCKPTVTRCPIPVCHILSAFLPCAIKPTTFTTGSRSAFEGQHTQICLRCGEYLRLCLPEATPITPIPKFGTLAYFWYFPRPFPIPETLVGAEVASSGSTGTLEPFREANPPI